MNSLLVFLAYMIIFYLLLELRRMRKEINSIRKNHESYCEDIIVVLHNLVQIRKKMSNKHE